MFFVECEYAFGLLFVGACELFIIDFGFYIIDIEVFEFSTTIFIIACVCLWLCVLKNMKLENPYELHAH